VTCLSLRSAAEQERREKKFLKSTIRAGNTHLESLGNTALPHTLGNTCMASLLDIESDSLEQLGDTSLGSHLLLRNICGGGGWGGGLAGSATPLGDDSDKNACSLNLLALTGGGGGGGGGVVGGGPSMAMEEGEKKVVKKKKKSKPPNGIRGRRGTHASTHIRTRTRTHKCTYMYIYMYVNVYICTHTYIHK